DGNKKIFFTRTGVQTSEINDKRFGSGKSVLVEAKSGDGRLLAHMYFRTFYRYPDAILVRSTFKNVSGKNYSLHDYTLNEFSVKSIADHNKWWSFQGASYYWGQNFVFELPAIFARENYMGLNDTRVGSGIPLTDVWNKQCGLALAYLGDKPRDIYMPVSNANGSIQMALKENYKPAS